MRLFFSSFRDRNIVKQNHKSPIAKKRQSPNSKLETNTKSQFSNAQNKENKSTRRAGGKLLNQHYTELSEGLTTFRI